MPSAGFKSRVEQILGPSNQVHAVAAVRLYVAESSKWEWTKVVGAAAIATSDQSRYLYVVDLNNNSIPLTQELYENFGYEAPRDFFHSFEMDDCVAGFSFADTADAKAFYQAVVSKSPGATQAPPRALPPVRPSPVTVTPAAPAHQSQFSPYSAQAPSTPTHQPTQPPVSPTMTKSASTPSPAAAASAKKKASGGGFFNKLKSAFASSDVPEDFVISDPRAFRHDSHIGWDPDAGFEIRNIPPEWRKLFQAAGVKKGDLRDPETAKFVMNVIGDTMLNQQPPAEEAPREAPPRAARTAGTFEPVQGGPSAGPPSSGGPPPPPPPPPPMSKGPAPPPVPTNKSAGKLPPTPQHDSRNDLMKSIQQGKELRKVDPNDPKGGLPDINNMNTTESKNLVDTLAAAMNARRNALQTDDEEQQEEEWSD